MKREGLTVEDLVEGQDLGKSWRQQDQAKTMKNVDTGNSEVESKEIREHFAWV